MKIWDILVRRKNYMEYLDYSPYAPKKQVKIEVRQLGLKKVVIVKTRRNQA